jgi:hypothetical protein
MPDEVAILRATGHEEAAKILEAMRAGEVAPAAAAAAAPSAQPAEEEQPSGLTREQLDGMSREEVLERMDEVDEALRRGV